MQFFSWRSNYRKDCSILQEETMRDVAVSADGLLINYEVQEQRLPALVFVHGWSCDLNYWQKQFAYFASRYTVVAIDLGGHGDSGLNRDSWTMPAFGEDVIAVVEKLSLTQVVLIGHSMGGTVVVEAAQRMPSQVIGVVGVDTFQNLGKIRTKEEIDAVLAPFYSDFMGTTEAFVRERMFEPSSDATLVATIAADMASAPAHVALDAAEWLYHNDQHLQAGLRTLRMPLVMINSDNSTNIEAAERFGISVKLMSGVGHFVMLEAPETFNHLLEETIKGFLAEISEEQYSHSTKGAYQA
jgi:pimeloyl-ACP methyl ester carboxylesterase